MAVMTYSSDWILNFYICSFFCREFGKCNVKANEKVLYMLKER